MKLSEFISLSSEEKKSTVLHEGILVAKRGHFSQMVFLFQFHSYYVEAYCDLKKGEIESYMAFTSMAHLQPYLETIQIEHLLQ